MSAQLLVLLLALVVEDEDLIGSAFSHNLAAHSCFRLWFADLSVATRERENFIETNFAVGAVADLLHPDHVSGCDSILFTTGADHRVHTHSSLKPHDPVHTSALG
jgi:hypothetical protein